MLLAIYCAPLRSLGCIVKLCLTAHCLSLSVSFNVHHNHKTLSRYNDKQLSLITSGSDFALRFPKPLFCLVHFGVAFRSRYDVLTECL